MRQRPLEILLAEDDADLADLVGRYLQESLRASVTHAESAADALREELTTRHDLLLVSLSLPDDGLELIHRFHENNNAPAIAMAQSPTVEEAIAAVRAGVTDILTKPFDLEYLSASVQKATDSYRSRRRERIRYKRLRKLVARIVCERRDLAKRIDLLCRDLVQAHRRLAEKVVQSGILTERRD